MPVAKGQHLGALRTLEDLRLRSYVDPHTGCWHVRRPSDGKPIDPDKDRLRIHGRVGQLSIGKAVHYLRTGKLLPPSMVNASKCGHRDCGNHDHRVLRSRQAHGRKTNECRESTAKQLAALMVNRPPKKVTPALLLWAIETGASSAELAQRAQCSRETARRHMVSASNTSPFRSAA